MGYIEVFVQASRLEKAIKASANLTIVLDALVRTRERQLLLLFHCVHVD